MRVLMVMMGVAVALGCVFAGPGALGGEIRVGKITIYAEIDASGLLVEEDGEVRISFPGARPWVLGSRDETWHPMAVGEIADALACAGFPVESLEAHIVVLPAPRRDLAASSTEGNVVFLTPGRVPYQREHVHYTVMHEMGHVVHNVLMPDSRRDLWEHYARMRGLEWPGSSTVEHASRPHEIFAEDFRMLFGSELARCGSGAENHTVGPPDAVPGLRDFFTSLPDMMPKAMNAYPNPFTERVAIECSVGPGVFGSTTLEVFDTRGRMVRTVGTRSGNAGAFVWDGRGALGEVLAPGVYFVRADHGLGVSKVVKAQP